MNNNPGFTYAYIPETLIDEKYKYLSDWVYKKLKAEFKNIRNGEIKFKNGVAERIWRKMKYFVPALDQEAFACWEMQESPLENEWAEYRFAYFRTNYPPHIDLPESIDGYGEDSTLAKVRQQAMQTALIQLHKEGEFEGVIDSYPCQILLSQCNDMMNEGSDSELFLTILSPEGEKPLPEAFTSFPVFAPCTDYYDDEIYNHLFSYYLNYKRQLKLDGNVLKRYDLDNLFLPTGKIVAADPYSDDMKEAFVQTVPPGEYEMSIYLDKNDSVALAALFFPSEGENRTDLKEAIRWAPAHNVQNNTAYTVTSAFGAFMDEQTMQTIRLEGGKLPVEEGLDYNTFDVAIGKNVAVFRSGIGNGTYLSFFGYNQKDKIICLVTNFHIIDRPQEAIPKKEKPDNPLTDIDNTDPKPFLYFSAGHVDDYSKLDIYIKFCSAPTKQQLRRITNNLPEPMDSLDFCDLDILSVDDGDNIDNEAIQDYYRMSNAPNNDAEGNDDEIEDSYGGEEEDEMEETQLWKEAMHAFEKRFNKWLFEVHAICPIQFVIRGRYDKPSTKISTSHWHHESMKQLPGLLQKFSDYKCTKLRQRNIFSHLLSILFCYAERENIDFSIEAIQKSSPRCYADFLMQKGNYPELKTAIQNEKDETALLSLVEGVGDCMCKRQNLDSYNHDTFYEIGKLIVATIGNRLLSISVGNIDPWGGWWLINTVNRLCYHHIVPKTIVMATIREDKPSLQNITALYHKISRGDRWDVLKAMNDLLSKDITQSKHWELARTLYEYTLGLIPDLGYDSFTEVSIYCNALYVYQKDNTGLPIDPEQNNRILALCLPHGDENPTVYYNAAGLYVEMQEYDKALDCMKQYFAKRTDDYYQEERKKLLKELKKDSAFNVFRKHQGVQEFINSLKR